VHDRALLGKQQGEDEQGFQEDGAQHAAHSNRRSCNPLSGPANGLRPRFRGLRWEDSPRETRG
jgi:hypothetical protein